MADFKIKDVGFYRTRDGRKARVLCTDAPGAFSCVGYAELENGKSSPLSWRLDGKMYYSTESSLDLVSPWTDPKPKLVAWRNKEYGSISYLPENKKDWPREAKARLRDHSYERFPRLPDAPEGES